MNKLNLPLVLTIAGTDPSGGAGIQADIKTISATKGYAASVITALVAQNTQGVTAIKPIDCDFIEHQLDVVFNDFFIQTIKIGMVFNQEIIQVLANYFEQRHSLPKIILDPVMIAKDGSSLLALDTVASLKRFLIPKAYLITPNIPEAEHLLETSIKNSQQMTEAAKIMAETWKINVLLKGGHLAKDSACDILYDIEDNQAHWFTSQRIKTRNTHGTGCTLSSAIASYLAQNYGLREAIVLAKEYLSQAIFSGSHYRIGQGQGPVDHFYFLRD